MPIDRRDFIRRGTLATVAANVCAIARADEGQTASPPPSSRAGTIVESEPIVQFDFVGLFAFHHFLKIKKRMTVILPTSPNVPHHAPLMVMPWDAFDDTRIGGEFYHVPPQPVHIGSTTMAMWTLAGMDVWIDEFNPGGIEKPEAVGNLTFPQDPGLRASRPSEPPVFADLKDLYWFADLGAITKRTEPFTIADIKEEYVDSRILLTRGTAHGRASVFPCENRRLYAFEYTPQEVTYPPNPRVFVTQMTVRHPIANSDYLTLMFKHRDYACRPARPLFLKLQPGRMPRINIMNLPLVHPAAATSAHFLVFYELVGEGVHTPTIKQGRNECPTKRLQDCYELQSHSPAAEQVESLTARPLGGSAPASPYDGCIPPGIPGEA